MMRTSLLSLLLLLCLAVCAQAQSETIISKQDADMMFGMNRSAWESYAQRMNPPLGWRARLLPQSTGTGFAAFDPATGMGLTVQPLFANETDPPDMIVVGSWYPVGRLRLTPALVADTERAAQRDLGPGYSVSASSAKLPELEGIQLRVSRKE
jgi:hypothetical protein